MKKMIGLMFALILIPSLCAYGGQPAVEQKAESGAAAETEAKEVTDAASENADADSGGVTQSQIEENIIGSWIVEERDGKPALTNEKSVFTFVSLTKAYLSMSFNARPEDGSPWDDLLEASVDITGSKVTVTWPLNVNTNIVDELSVSSITNTENQGSLIVKSVENGREAIILEEPVRLVKVSHDYSKDILGTWEGRCTSEASIFDDGQDHRWEFKDDGTYVYYLKEGEDWIPSMDALSEYFVAGNLLCARWLEGDDENREWWEISIDGDKMNWTALREDEDGKTFTTTFEMKRVEE